MMVCAHPDGGHPSPLPELDAHLSFEACLNMVADEAMSMDRRWQSSSRSKRAPSDQGAPKSTKDGLGRALPPRSTTCSEGPSSKTLPPTAPMSDHGEQKMRIASQDDALSLPIPNGSCYVRSYTRVVASLLMAIAEQTDVAA